MDSDGDGIGDLRGIIARLDHVAGLGIDAIWLSPHFNSPNVDNGYDIRDYRKVMAEFGTMADFDALLAAIKARGMRLILDLVVNHTSDQHAWFVESRASRDNAKRDFYIWRPGRDGGPPNDWRSFFSGSAWTRDDATGDYYMHLFAEQQPDLNWENPEVRREVHDLMRFWLDKGVDGFRMDVIPFIAKDPAFPDYPEALRSRPEFYHAGTPRLHEHLAELRREVLDPYGAVTIGEAFGVTMEQACLLTDEARGELDMLIHFDAVRVDRGVAWRWQEWTLPQLKAVFDGQDAAMGPGTWRTIALSNHDNPRLVSHFGDDAEPWREPSAKALATLLLTLKGTPFVYQGDEIAMTNFPFERIEQFDDIEARNAWASEVATGQVSPGDFLWHMNRTSRDHARTPVAWDDGPNGGFTAGHPWFAPHPDARRINAAAALRDPGSIYHYYARFIALRKTRPELVYGDFRDLAPEHPQLYCYTRLIDGRGVLVLLNLSGAPAALPAGIEPGALLIGTQDGPEGRQMRPWEARLHAV
ncbi:MAG: alpha-glucosidase [Amaricoccus sp.]|uniref:glycoside hydrolase family 13 protein n=1 Tax=Amaricoccus sp. TaxID=1872485 RepID=UPI0039E3C4D3